MPTGIEEALVVNEIALEAEKETIRELATEITEFSKLENVKTRLSEHKLTSKDIDRVFDNLKERGIKSISRASEELGDRLSRIELEKRGNLILDVQPQYGQNPETNLFWRADYKFSTLPGSSFREVVRIGNHYFVSEKISSVRIELLLDVKNHNLESLYRNLPDTLNKIERMKRLSPETGTVISIPEDIALRSEAANAIAKMQEAGAKVITHAPYEASMHEAIRRYFELKYRS